MNYLRQRQNLMPFAASDRITTLCSGAIKDLKPKREIGLAGFTNTKVAELFDPPLTVVRQPAFDMGQTAIELPIQIIESKRPVVDFQTKIFATELVVRESSIKKK